MDGRKTNPLTLFGWVALGGVLLLPSMAAAQAMGKAVIEGAPPIVAPEAPKIETPKVPAAEIIPSAAPAVAAASLPPANPVATRPAVSPPPAVSATPAVKVAAEPVARGVAPAATGENKIADAVADAVVGKPAVVKAPSVDDSFIRRPAASAPSASQPAEEKKPDSTPSGYKGLAQVGAALAVVIGLIFIGKALARKFVPGAKATSGKGVIEILARHPLAKNQSLVLVRIGSQIVALNQGKETSESVLVISEPTEVANIIGQIEGKNPNSISSGFNKLLANARIDLEEGSDESDLSTMNAESLDDQLDEMAAAKRQLMEMRQHVRSVRDRLPRA